MARRAESDGAPREQGARLRMGGDTPGLFAEKIRSVPLVARSATKRERRARARPGGLPRRGGGARPGALSRAFPRRTQRVSLVARQTPPGARPPAAALECQGICETVH